MELKYEDDRFKIIDGGVSTVVLEWLVTTLDDNEILTIKCSEDLGTTLNKNILVDMLPIDRLFTIRASIKKDDDVIHTECVIFSTGPIPNINHIPSKVRSVHEKLPIFSSRSARPSPKSKPTTHN